MAPPPEAMRKAGVSTVLAVVIAVVTLAVGIGIGYVIPRPSSPPAPTILLVGTNMPFPPFEDFNATSAEIEGFDIDLAKLIADDLGRELVIQQFSDFQVLLATIGTGGVDMAASAITSSGTSGATRNQTMDFSDSYYDANQGILVTTASTLVCAGNICAASDLAGLEVGAQAGTTSEAWLQDNALPSTIIVSFVTVEAEIAALKAGSIDAVMIDFGPAESFANAPGSGMKMAGKVITGELYSFAVPNGDPQGIVPRINALLSRIKADGTYDQLIAKWFG